MGISHIFVTSFGRYPCRRWHTFSSGKFLRPPITELFFCTKIPFWYAHDSSAALEYRLSVDSQITVICNGSVNRPFSFTAARDSAVYRTISNTVGLQREWRYCDRFLSVTLFLFWASAFSPWSKLRVIIWSMLRFRTTLHIPFANVFPSFELLLHKCPSYAHF